jgi:hypothetical protein
MHHDDSRLVQHIRDNLLITPAPPLIPYGENSDYAKPENYMGDVAHVMHLFNHKVRPNILLRFKI